MFCCLCSISGTKLCVARSHPCSGQLLYDTSYSISLVLGKVSYERSGKVYGKYKVKSVGSSSGLYQKIRFLFLLYLQAIGGVVARESNFMKDEKMKNIMKYLNSLKLYNFHQGK